MKSRPTRPGRPARPGRPSGSETTLIVFNKPYDVLCQFTDGDGRQTLADFIDKPGYYAAGRLDKDSEGLLLLTSDGSLQHKISHPRHKLTKRYLAQVDGSITPQAIQTLQRGVELNDGPARAIAARAVEEPAWLWVRHPPVRVRRHIPTSWLEISLREGRNRQVRRMTAATGFPTLRLVRTRIGRLDIGSLPPGNWRYATPSAL